MSELKKMYYSISEVADMLSLKPHVLRFWEQEFSRLRPKKNRSGNRAYVEKDIALLRQIRHLLYEEKYTIEGARIKLSRKSHQDEIPDTMVSQYRNELVDIRNQLGDILKMIDKM